MLTYFLVFFALLALSEANNCVVNGKTIPGCQTVLTTPAEFVALSNNKKFVLPATPPPKVLVGPGAKILFDFRDPTVVRDRTWYIDTTLYPSHSNFISAMGETAEYNKDTTKWFRCDWQSYVDLEGKWFFAMTINPGFKVVGDTIMTLCKNAAVGLELRKAHANGWLSLDPATQTFNKTVIDYCAKLGFQVKDLDDLMSGTVQNFAPLHTGEAYGILRVHPKPEEVPLLAPTSIPIFNFLPLDLGVVQGTVTSVYQTTNSHVNLKSNERNTPNMILLNFASFPCIAALNGKPVHLQVSKDGWGIEAATQKQVDDWFRNQVNREKWLYLKHNNVTEVRSFEKMCSANDPGACIIGGRAIYGTKASSLGFLRHPKVLGLTTDKGSPSALFGQNLTIEGFGIPMQYYVDFINYPPNANIKALIEQITNMEMAGEVADDVRYNMSMKTKTAFWNAQIPPKIINHILEMCYEIFYPLGIYQIKLRSSSNAEDLPGFDGAGLYDSFPCDYTSVSPTNECYYDPDLDAMVPDTLDCALKGVYGSLFNIRAITERTFARFVHSTCAMGIAVNPRYTNFGKVVSNAVSITKNLEPSVAIDTPAYTFSIQTGDNDVTNPEPGTTGESTLRIYNEDGSSYWKTVRYAVPVAGFLPLTTNVLTPDLMSKMLYITEFTEKAYCLYVWKLPAALCAKASLYWKKTGLDSEFKFVRLDTNKSYIRVINKQLREFSGDNSDDVTVVTINGTCKSISPLFFAGIPGKTTINVALHKTANQSLTYLKGYAQNAINGDATGDNYNSALVAYGKATTNSWLLDLQKDYTPLAIRIFATKNSGVTYPSMNSFNVQFLNAKNTVTYTWISSKQGTLPVIEWKNATNTAKARYIRVNGLATTTPVLAFTEFQVWAPPSEVGAGDQFPRAVRPLTPNACVHEEWSQWSTCSGRCGLAVANRTRGPDFCRTNDNNASYEERSCGPTCPVDCLGFWSGWTLCDCLSKKQFSTFFVLQDPLYGGACPGKTGTIRTQSCTPVDCPVDCDGAWSDWSSCSCSNSSQSRVFVITTPSENGGAECLFNESSTEDQFCFPAGCPVPPPVDEPASPNGPIDAPDQPPTENPVNKSEDGTNVGAVVGVTIGCFAAALVAGLVVVHFLFPKPEAVSYN